MYATQIRIALGCLAVALITAAFAATWFAGAHHNEMKHVAAEAKANADLVKQVTEDALSAIRINQVVAEAIGDSSNTIKELAAHVQPRVYVSSCSVQPVRAADLFLDAGTVGLLDAAAQVPTASTAERSDAASQAIAASAPEHGIAASSVSVADLVQYDFTLIDLYNELARRHDALVDFVEQAMKARSEPR
jgi:hypothetical protein